MKERSKELLHLLLIQETLRMVVEVVEKFRKIALRFDQNRSYIHLKPVFEIVVDICQQEIHHEVQPNA